MNTARRALATATLALAAFAAPTAAAEGRPLVSAAAAADGEPPVRTRSMGDEAVRTAVALGGVLSLVLVIRHLVRRRPGSAAIAASGIIETLGRTPIGRGRSVLLLRVGPRILCVHEGPQEMRTLCEFNDPREVEPLLSALTRRGEPVETVDLTRREPRPPAGGRA